MPSLEDHHSEKTVKLLLLGASGAGKSGHLAYLAKAGYRLFIYDFDNGLDILKDPTILPLEYHKNVFFQPMMDKIDIVGDKAIMTAQGYDSFVKSLGKWMEGTTSMGGCYTWGEKDVIVIDSLSFLCNAVVNQVLLLAGHTKLSQPDFGNAMDKVESVLEMLYNPRVKCNVVVTAHVTPGKDETGKHIPHVLGQKLAPKVPRYFNNMVYLEKTGHGAATKSVLHTRGTFNVDCKVSRPGAIPPVMDPADLGKLFALLKGEVKPVQLSSTPIQSNLKK